MILYHNLFLSLDLASVNLPISFGFVSIGNLLVPSCIKGMQSNFNECFLCCTYRFSLRNVMIRNSLFLSSSVFYQPAPIKSKWGENVDPKLKDQINAMIEAKNKKEQRQKPLSRVFKVPNPNTFLILHHHVEMTMHLKLPPTYSKGYAKKCSAVVVAFAPPFGCKIGFVWLICKRFLSTF